jgi:phage terminase large subunit
MQLAVNEVFWECLTTDKRYVHSYGSRGSGKSRQEAIGFVLDILNPEYFKGVLVREVQDTIRHSQFAEIKAVIEGAELESRIEINETRMEFFCPATGNSIISRGLKKSKTSDTARFKSITDPSKVWSEEAEEISKDDFIKIDGSVRKKNVKCQIRLTYNTNIEPEHWIRQDFHDPQREDTFYLHTTYLVNVSNLDAKYISSREELKHRDYDRYLVDVMGHWGSKKVERPFATQYDQKKHFKECYFQQQRTVFLSMDFNLDPFAFTFGHIWQDIDGFHFWIFDEMSIEGGNLPEAVSQIRAKYGAWLHNFVVCGDYNGNNRSIQSASLESNYQMLQRLLNLNSKQMKVKPNPRHKNSRSDCNFLLAHAEDLRIHTNCVSLDADMRLVEVDADEKIIKQDRKKIGQKADLLDAFRYMADTQDVKDWMKIKQSNVTGLR